MKKRVLSQGRRIPSRGNEGEELKRRGDQSGTGIGDKVTFASRRKAKNHNTQTNNPLQERGGMEKSPLGMKGKSCKKRPKERGTIKALKRETRQVYFTELTSSMNRTHI